ncbi:Mpp10 protein [Metarhizium rileyi]|uniref:U3 small nucleolar ribonucleoprotein protein MPP10 n=1 Tax=Metarhizium rileyi (strain RCEF 4871) TaxID=1649241 RepID=A0A166WT42_METRR|nr:Mpp10 protein [Metarhizium rileyi RCEF 4871]
MAPASAANSSPAADIISFLVSLQPENRHVFLEPSASIPSDSLSIVKNTVEDFAAKVGDAQQERLKESRKRKRGGDRVADDVLKLRKVYVDGFETGQVWQQTKKIIDGVLKFSEDIVDELEEKGELVACGVDSEEDEPGLKSVTFGTDGFEVDSDEEESEVEVDGLSEEEGDEDDSEGEGEGEEDDVEDVAIEDELDDEEAEEEKEDDLESEEGYGDEAEEYVEDPNGLNDGFFSIDDFNKQTQWFEDQDTRADPNTDQASDDEDIDWAADPLAPAQSSKKSSNKRGTDEPHHDEESDDDDGPTFGNMALDAPEGASDDEAMDVADDVDDDDEANDFNANEVYYKDFFAPPSRKHKTGKPPQKKKEAAHLKPQPPNEDDMERAMANVKRDLFDDESENSDSGDALSDVSAGDPKSRRSAHERRQAKLAEEIRKLEAASVAKREWTLSGEAAAVDRPMNSLLEEDMDFEHVGKPVPVITPEISESIEDLIKRRILSQEFDEVLRRRPDTDSVPAHTRRGLVELDDSKPNKSLAEVYEEEHIKNTNPDTYVSKSDEKLQREEKEVEAMWKDVSARLDALSSWHYKPKPAAAQLSVVSDVATVAMEDAQPTTAQGVAGQSSRMAPQEIYTAGADKGSVAKGEVVTRAGLPLARQEMSREDKARRRRRHKERVRKAGGADAQDGRKPGPRAKMQRDTVAELKKGGVKVINRKGEITDVDGNKAKAKKPVTSGSFKL